MIAPLEAKQRLAVQLGQTHRITVYEGSVRSTKTITSLIGWLLFVRTGPPGNLLMAGKTERTLKRNVIDPLVEMLGPHRCRYVAGSGELHLLGRLVYIAGANDQRAQEKIRGLTLVGAYVDEATTLPESFWSMLLTRLSVDGARLLATTNPDSPRHWLKRSYLNRAATHLTHDGEVLRRDGDDRLDLARLSFRLADNPHLPPAYVTALAAEFVGLWYRRYVLGEWVIAEGAVYDLWDDRKHVVDRVPAIARWWLAVDYGTTNPFSAILFGLGDDGVVYAVNELRTEVPRTARRLTDVEHSERVRGWLANLEVTPEWVFVDPSAASFKAQLRADGMTGVRDADNDVLDGIRTVASALATGRFKVHRSCAGWLSEVVGYAWDPKATEKGADAPIKADDHSMDAGRYGLHSTRRLWRRPTIPEAA